MNTAPATAQDFTLRTTVYTEDLGSRGTVRIVPLSPEEDLDLIHGWVTQDRARFWGMTEYSRSDVLEVYEFLDSLRRTTRSWCCSRVNRWPCSRPTSPCMIRWARPTRPAPRTSACTCCWHRPPVPSRISRRGWSPR